MNKDNNLRLGASLMVYRGSEPKCVDSVNSHRDGLPAFLKMTRKGGRDVTSFNRKRPSLKVHF